MWDSGKVLSAQSVNVVYAGAPLESGKTYYWKVRVWDNQGRVSPYSRPATFEMGLLKPDDWKSGWYGCDVVDTALENPAIYGPMCRSVAPTSQTVRAPRQYLVHPLVFLQPALAFPPPDEQLGRLDVAERCLVDRAPAGQDCQIQARSGDLTIPLERFWIY